MRKAFKDLPVIPEVEDSQEDILPVDNASDLIDELSDDIEQGSANFWWLRAAFTILRLSGP